MRSAWFGKKLGERPLANGTSRPPRLGPESSRSRFARSGGRRWRRSVRACAGAALWARGPGEAGSAHVAGLSAAPADVVSCEKARAGLAGGSSIGPGVSQPCGFSTRADDPPARAVTVRETRTQTPSPAAAELSPRGNGLGAAAALHPPPSQSRRARRSGGSVRRSFGRSQPEGPWALA